MTFGIDDAFIRKWHPKYDEIEDDEADYKNIILLVSNEIRSFGIISKERCKDIYRWKAVRAINYADWDRYEELYAPAFQQFLSVPQERKLAAIINLPGIKAAVGSTIIHFIHPESMPIIDRRTAEVLRDAGLISTKRTTLRHYEEFRKAIDGIRHRCPSWSLRQIDRALFAFHKQTYSRGCDDHAWGKLPATPRILE
jgi:hypothetical protein